LLLLLPAGRADGPSETKTETESREVTLTPSPGDGAKYWPRWRGPSGQGHVDGKGYPDRWSSEENVIWKVPVPGSGNSSPIVWGDFIFLTSAAENGKSRGIVAFRRSDGKQLWEARAPESRPEQSHRKNGLASSTPTTDGQRVYAYLGNHGVLAVDFEGKQVWHRSLGSFEAFHGTASSPLLHEERLIVVQDHGGGSFIAALDTRNGDELWRTSRPSKVGWSTPIAIRAGGREAIVYSAQQQVEAYDPTSGKLLWKVRGNTFETIPTPVVGHGLLFASSGRAGPTLAIRPGGSGDVTKSSVVWRAVKGSPFVPSAILHDDYLYMVNDMSAIATCYKARTGEVMWQGRLGRVQREGFSASPVVVDGKVFFTNDDGVTFVLAAGPEFELLRTNDLGEPVLASPALVDGRWYFRTTRHLLAIGAATSSQTLLDAPFSFGTAETPLEVRLNDKGPFRFGFDSGASVPVMLEPRLVEELQLETQDRYAVSAGDASSSIMAKGTTLSSLDVQGLHLESVEAMVLEGADPEGRDGTLGFPLFDGLLLTLDFERSRLVARGGGSLDGSDPAVLSYVVDRGLPLVSVGVGPLAVEATLDSGSGAGFMLPPSFIDRLPLVEEPVAVGKIATLFDETDLLAATLDGDLTLGAHRVERPRVFFATIVDRPNLGREALSDFAVTFDPARGLVRFDR
jgi:outer membrane protein assembly factor BamB